MFFLCYTCVSLLTAMPFAKGKSGNPGGRRVGLSRIIRSKTKEGAELVDMLLEMVRTAEEPKDRIAAAKLLMEFGFSRPPTELEHSGTDGGPIQVITGVPLVTPAKETDAPDEP